MSISAQGTLPENGYGKDMASPGRRTAWHAAIPPRLDVTLELLLVLKLEALSCAIAFL